MANLKLKRKQNVDGNFYVDSTCISCGACWWVAKEVFKESSDSLSMVYRRPENNRETYAAFRALYSCPTNSIGVHKSNSIHKKVLNSFPFHLHENIYHCGFHAEASYGAASYLIKTSRGNFMIDSPRFVKKLAESMKRLGGIQYQCLTHKDDVADTDKYWNIFKGQRMIHIEDSQKASHYEKFFQDQNDKSIDKDLMVIPTPGHTKGSVCFLYKQKFLFTGDHLAFSIEKKELTPFIFRSHTKKDISIYIKSLEKLLHYNFEYILPGHGAPFFAKKSKMQHSIKECIENIKEYRMK
ncbi:MAG: ferredoxin [Halobacteriovoraceae bacterium]|nr:ferredoxin [Halobacteriovoraceae bacterium]